MGKDFFKSASESSRIKIEIVSKYFYSWSKVITPRTSGNIAYIDLFSGKGIYEDGTKSIPILILESAIREENVRKKLVSIFNDASHSKDLHNTINKINDIDKLKHPPRISDDKVDEDFAKHFTDINLVPTLLFVDP